MNFPRFFKEKFRKLVKLKNTNKNREIVVYQIIKKFLILLKFFILENFLTIFSTFSYPTKKPKKMTSISFSHIFLTFFSFFLRISQLIQRAAKTDIQQEEYSNFISMSEDLDTALLNLQNRKGASDDTTIKTLQRMKNITLVQFLAGIKKEKIVSKRKKHTKSAMKDTTSESTPTPNVTATTTVQ